jgi:hypothetical protein
VGHPEIEISCQIIVLGCLEGFVIWLERLWNYKTIIIIIIIIIIKILEELRCKTFPDLNYIVRETV